MLLNKKLRRRLFSTLALTTLFGANAYSAENIFLNNLNYNKAIGKKNINKFAEFFIDREFLENQNYLNLLISIKFDCLRILNS